MRRFRRLVRWRDALLRRGIHARSCFQTFVTGGIVFGCSLATLYLTENPPDAFLLLLWLLMTAGGLMAVAGYLSLMIFRFTDFLTRDTQDDEE
ncbi:hypothetical protein AAIA72_06000 [Hahella sp. SMD15-11]|uniref:DUF2721 domain-containing protein n=1 Tax=Thermohahella caldifontis TaxID=3142973 RepID=A0AB39UZZ1_9GAMM